MWRGERTLERISTLIVSARVQVGRIREDILILHGELGDCAEILIALVRVCCEGLFQDRLGLAEGQSGCWRDVEALEVRVEDADIL
jgi:hypothetical protein